MLMYSILYVIINMFIDPWPTWPPKKVTSCTKMWDQMPTNGKGYAYL